MRLTDIPDFQRAGLIRTLRRALFRAITEADLLAYIKDARPPEHLAVEEIASRELSKSGRRSLREIVAALATAGDSVPSRDRPAYDRRIKHLLPLLNPAEAVAFALENLSHPRKARRETAVRFLRGAQLKTEPLAKIITAYEDSPNPTLAAVLAKNAEGLESSRLAKLLEYSDSEVDRVLIIQALLKIDDLSDTIVNTYPLEVIWAAGRTRRRDLLPTVHSIVMRAEPDQHLFSIYVWSLGRLGDLESIHFLEQEIYQSLEEPQQ